MVWHGRFGVRCGVEVGEMRRDRKKGGEALIVTLSDMHKMITWEAEMEMKRE